MERFLLAAALLVFMTTTAAAAHSTTTTCDAREFVQDRVPRFPSLEKNLVLQPAAAASLMDLGLSITGERQWNIKWSADVELEGVVGALYLNGFLIEELSMRNRTSMSTRQVLEKGDLAPLNVRAVLFFANSAQGIFARGEASVGNPDAATQAAAAVVVVESISPSPNELLASDGRIHLVFRLQEAENHATHAQARVWCDSDLVLSEFHLRSDNYGSIRRLEEAAIDGDTYSVDGTLTVCCENVVAQVTVLNSRDVPVGQGPPIPVRFNCPTSASDLLLLSSSSSSTPSCGGGGKTAEEAAAAAAEEDEKASKVTSGNFFPNRGAGYGFFSEKDQANEEILPSAASVAAYLRPLYAKYADELKIVRAAARALCLKPHARCRQGTDDMEAEVLYMRMREYKPKRVLELSPDNGYSTTYILHAIQLNDNGGHVFGIDIHDLSEHVIEAELLDSYTFIHANACDPDSMNTLRALHPVDYLHVDADHTKAFGEWCDGIVNIFAPAVIGRKGCVSMSVHDVFHGLGYTSTPNSTLHWSSYPTWEGDEILKWLAGLATSPFGMYPKSVYTIAPFVHPSLAAHLSRWRTQLQVAQAWNDDAYTVAPDYLPRRNTMLFFRLCENGVRDE